MRARQAKKIVRIAEHTPINRIPPRWLNRAIKFATNRKKDATIGAAKRYYWKGVIKRKFKQRY